MGQHVVGTVQELPPGSRKIVDVEGRSIGVFNVGGTFYALRNSCPHQAAPLCRGSVKGMTTWSKENTYEYVRDGEILRCPWHGWEFDVTNGRSIFNPHKVRVRAYQVTVEPDEEDLNDPAVPTYPVTVERGRVVVHV
jgi:3-phenylpropionate/trans-cinnamate dioxygenase ferredoxin subunit